MLFFAVISYARITTLGEEVRDTDTHHPKMIPIAPGITLLLYAVVTWAVMTALGPQQVANSADTLARAIANGS